MARIATALGLSAALTSASFGDAHGFAVQGNTWANQGGDPIIYRLHPEGAADVPDRSDLDAIRRSFTTWQSVACSYLQFQEGEWMEPRTVANDGVNRIFWAEGAGEWPEQQASTLALTYTFYRTEDHRITDADIIVNGVNWRFTTTEGEIGMGTPAAIDLETVLFHEIGHFVGLDHSQETSAAMYPSNNKLKQREPTVDDIQGICSLYPNGQPIPTPMGPPVMGGPVGAPCSTATDCASNRCAEDPVVNRTYCTEQCDPMNVMSCPTGYECAATSQGNFCLAPALVDELCDKCDQGAQCASGFCTSVPNVNNNRPYCSRPCDPTPGQPAQCPQGYSCLPVLGEVGGACAPNDGVCEPAGKGGQNEICFANGTCKAGFTCVEYYPQSGLNFCYYACPVEFTNQSCGVGTICRPVADVMNSAVCFSVAAPGQPCIPEICDDTSWCAFDENAGIDSALCYKTCNGNQDCGPQSACQAVPGAPNLCVPLEGFKYEGESCTGDAECRSHTCRTYGSNRLCTSPCATTDASSCGAGLKCVPQSGSTQGLCWPESYIDRSAQGPIDVRPDFCSCDFSRACDGDCPCDPECSGCSCSAIETRSMPAFGIFALLVFALIRRIRL